MKIITIVLAFISSIISICVTCNIDLHSNGTTFYCLIGLLSSVLFILTPFYFINDL
jgi:hypothetical protein